MRADALGMYAELLQEFVPGESIVSCMNGEIVPPALLDLSAPPESEGFPPALIPVWSKGSGPWYYGYWRHWFVPRRPTYVVYGLDSADAYEYGRSFLQLVGGMVLRDVEINEGLTGEARRFLEAVGYPDLVDFERLLADGGDHPSILAEHVVFRGALPLVVFEDGGGYREGYKGDFPNPADRGSWRYASSIELEADVLVGDVPFPRLVLPDLKLEFQRCVQAGDLGSAWLALNCRGWSFREASRAIGELAGVAGNSAFSMLAGAWSLENGDLAGGY